MSEPVKPIKKLIICSPYKEPDMYWRFNPHLGRYEKMNGRRPAGYTRATDGSRRGDDAGFFEEIPHINRIRKKVSEWRMCGYEGATGTTRRLLKRWRDVSMRSPDSRLFYCQLEAIETIIWAHEIGRNDALIRKLEGDGSGFKRLCCKMATGTGKTVVMAMLIAWQVLNHLNDRGAGFTRNVLIVAPSISVRRRLAVLDPSNPNNYYEKFAIVDRNGLEALNRARIVTHNWHVLMNMAEQKKPAGQASRVMRDIPVSDIKFSKDVLGHTSRNILVINDEAHHAWRPVADGDVGRTGKDAKDEMERATRWMEGLDRIHQDRGIMTCYDFSATPFRPTGHSVSEVERFKWVISDFSLEDAIESGLVKTPKTPKYDDSGITGDDGASRFHHIFPQVRGDFGMRRNESDPLPQLVSDAYEILGDDWKRTLQDWRDSKYAIPPVMITVCNNTKSASRIVNHFNANSGRFGDLAGGMEKIDSMALDSKDDDGSRELRTKIDTVGKEGEPGQDVTHVVSVNMLTEGWDAHNVTHIMGLRAFESQLLCEQVVGRGLRRNSYEVDCDTGLLLPEYVNVFGIPFSFMPHEGSDDAGETTSQPVTAVYPEDSKSEYEIGWPDGSVKMEHRERLGPVSISPIEIQGGDIATSVTVAQLISGKHIGPETELKVDGMRLQELVFRISLDVGKRIWPGTMNPARITDLIRAVEGYVSGSGITVAGVHRSEKEKYARSLKAKINDIVEHVVGCIQYEKTTSTYFKPDDPAHPVKSTKTMPRWYSRRRWLPEDDVSKCHLNVGVYDTEPEKDAMREFERNSLVRAWVKNDQHLGFRIPYHFEGAWHDYYPDFLAVLDNGVTAVIEVKGAEEEEAGRKQKALDEWVDAVNNDGGYGAWVNCGMVRNSAGLKDVLDGAGSDSKQSESTGGAPKQVATCPSCGAHASGRKEIMSAFGFRRTSGITRPQSWCKECRSDRRHQGSHPRGA